MIFIEEFSAYQNTLQIAEEFEQAKHFIVLLSNNIQITVLGGGECQCRQSSIISLSFMYLFLTLLFLGYLTTLLSLYNVYCTLAALSHSRLLNADLCFSSLATKFMF